MDRKNKVILSLKEAYKKREVPFMDLDCFDDQKTEDTLYLGITRDDDQLSSAKTYRGKNLQHFL